MRIYSEITQLCLQHPHALTKAAHKGLGTWLPSYSSDVQAFEVNCSTVMFHFIVSSFLFWGCDISAFNTFTLQNPKLFISHVMLDWLPCLAQCSMNVTVQLVDEGTVWGRGALEYVCQNEAVSPKFGYFHEKHPWSLLMAWGGRKGDRQYHEQGYPERHWGHQSQEDHFGLRPSGFPLLILCSKFHRSRCLSVKLSLKSNAGCWPCCHLARRDQSCRMG